MISPTCKWNNIALSMKSVHDEWMKFYFLKNYLHTEGTKGLKNKTVYCLEVK